MNTLTPGIRRRRCRELSVRGFTGLVALGVALAIGCGGERARSQEGLKGMDQLLERQLTERSGDARETARQAGAQALPVLRRFAQAGEAGQRSLALECFAEIGGDEAILALAAGLEDSSLNVRKAAVFLLQRVNGPAAADKLSEVLAHSPHEWIRGNAALLLGRLDNPGAAGAIQQRLGQETSPEPRRMMTLAVARLRDGDARQGVLARLAAPDAGERYAAIGDLEYLNVPALLARLEPLWGDTAVVRNVGTEPYPVWHRVCDRAVEAVAALQPGRLRFPVGKRTYGPQEIAEARQVAAAAGR
jgi:hypothetical protein